MQYRIKIIEEKRAAVITSYKEELIATNYADEVLDALIKELEPEKQILMEPFLVREKRKNGSDVVIAEQAVCPKCKYTESIRDF